LWKSAMNNMRKYKEWAYTTSGYGSFWDFGSVRVKIWAGTNESGFQFKVYFFNRDSFIWREVWTWQYYRKDTSIEQFRECEKLICQDIVQLIDGG
jgi:hypothetical protein